MTPIHTSTRLTLALLGVAAACSRAPSPRGSAPDTAGGVVHEVRTVKVGLEPWERTVSAVGSLAAFEEATISAKVPGRLAELSIDLGSPIRRGEIVARLESRDYELAVARSEAALAQTRASLGLSDPAAADDLDPETTALVRHARAELAEAQINRERVVGLRESEISSKAAEDQAESALRVAESELQGAIEEVATRRALLVQRRAELAIARAALEDASIRAPFDGTTLARIAGTGDYLSAGDPIARVARVDPLRLRLDIPERESVLVQVGQTVRLGLESSSLVHAGTIVRISPAVGTRNRALVVEAEVPNRRPSSPGGTLEEAGAPSEPLLRPGAFARADIVIDADVPTLTVPLAAVATFAGIDKVIEVADGRAVERRIVLGRRDGERVEVLSGLEPGAEVVLHPGSLTSGASVKPEE